MADLTAQGYQPTDTPDLVNGDYKKMLADLQTLNTQVGDMVQQVATLVSSDSTMAGQITALQQKNTAQDGEIQSLQDSLSRFAVGGLTQNVRFTVSESSFGVVFMTNDTDGYVLLLPVNSGEKCELMSRNSTGDHIFKSW